MSFPSLAAQHWLHTLVQNWCKSGGGRDGRDVGNSTSTLPLPLALASIDSNGAAHSGEDHELLAVINKMANGMRMDDERSAWFEVLFGCQDERFDRRGGNNERPKMLAMAHR